MDFLKKYKNFDYVTDDDSIGFGYGFRNRWIENKKFYSLINFDFKNRNNILLIRRINNCESDQHFKKIDFFNWCYKEYN